MTDSLPEHFYLAPSSASRWIHCPGSLRASADIEDTGSEAASIGSLGHALVEAELRGEVPDADLVEFFESLDENVRQFLQEAVDLCVDHVSQLEGDVQLYETKIQSDLLEEHGGTVDVINYDSKTRILHLVDFKFGRVKVDIEDNKQIKCYLVLAKQLFPEAERFLGSIIQPKISDEMKTAEFTREELDQHEADVLEASISSHFKAGDHCLWCPASPTCETLANYTRDQVKEFPDLTQFVGGITGKPTEEEVEKLCRVYKTFKLVETATKGAGDILKRWEREGANITPHGLGVRVSLRQKWADNAEEVLQSQGVNSTVYTKEPSFLTPNQVRTSLGISKGKFDELFGVAIEEVETRSLVMGKDEKEFPEFPDE